MHPAYLLHRHDWSENSLIVELFMRPEGRVAAVAKGAKRPTSQLRAVLLPFQRISAALTRPSGRSTSSEGSNDSDLATLRSAEWVGGGPLLAGDALFAGFYLNELLLRLLPRRDAHPRLFDAYAATLPALAAGEPLLAEAALRAFELVLLRELGWLPDLAVNGTTLAPLAATARARLTPEAGLIDAGGDATAPSGATWAAIAAALQSGELSALQHACAAELPALKAQLRAALAYHQGHPRWRTRDVLQSAQQLLTP